jgi:hypothetical protein
MLHLIAYFIIIEKKKCIFFITLNKKMMAYSLKKKKMVKIDKVLEKKKLKNGAHMILGLDKDGDKVSRIMK